MPFIRKRKREKGKKEERKKRKKERKNERAKKRKKVRKKKRQKDGPGPVMNTFWEPEMCTGYSRAKGIADHYITGPARRFPYLN